MARFDLLVLDLDNTVYDWYSAFIPAFYAMVDRAAQILHHDPDHLLTQLKLVHQRHADVEHPFSLMETDIAQEYIRARGEDRAWRELDPAFHDFNRVRKDRLKLFPDVQGTLRALRGAGVNLVGYTDSKYYSVVLRISRLQLGDLLSKVYCREKSVESTTASANARSVAFQSPPVPIIEIPSHKAKPNPQVLADIMNGEGCNATQVAYVGDSIAKDMLMAKQAGCFAIWAKYGATVDRDLYAKLVRVSHWTERDIAIDRQYSDEARSVAPDFVCETSIKEMLPVILEEAA